MKSQKKIQTEEINRRNKQKENTNKTLLFNILIVEDDKELSLLFQKVLEKSGYQVKSASDGAQALEVLDKEYIDLIISDIMMPVMDGLEAARQIRAMDRPDAKLIPIVAMSANAFQDDVERSKQAGMNKHISKPLTGESVIREIKRML